MTDFVYQADIELIEKNETQVELSLFIPENLYYFQGHFPQAAILPGVVLMDWVVNFLEEYFAVDKSTVVSIDALKFQQIIRPKNQVTLHIKQAKGNKYAFSYCSADGQYASGKVVLSS